MKWFLSVLLLCFLQADPQITLKVNNKKYLRENAPVLLDISLSSSENTKGNLILYSGDDLEFYRSTNLVLTKNNANNFQFWLPPSNNIQYSAAFAVDGYEYSLGIVNIGRHTSFVITSISSGDSTEMVDALNIFKFLPSHNGTRYLATIKRIKPEIAPQDAATAYFDTDLLIVNGDSLALLNKDQLLAIANWVSIGGSACIVQNQFTMNLQNWHHNFISQIQSKQDYIAPLDNVVVGKYFGWGRVMFCDFSNNIPPDFATLHWRRFIFLLWKVRSAVSQQVINYGTSKVENLPFVTNNYYQNSYDYNTASGSIGNYLVPQSIEIPPTYLLTILLVIFLIIVGPVEYKVLKKLNKRSLTWITFPLATVCFWLVCQYIADIYLGDVKASKTVQIFDLDSNKEVSRYQEFNFFMSSKPQTIKNHVKNAIQVNLDTRINYYTKSNNEHCSYHGHFPFDYTVTQKLQKWTPYMRRTIQRKADFSENIQFVNTLLEDFTYFPQKEIFRHQYRNSSRNYESEKDYRVNFAKYPGITHFNHVYILHLENIYKAKGNANDFTDGIIKYTSTTPKEINIIFSQMSPSGEESAINDLTIHDITDNKQIVVILIREEQDTIKVFRQLIYKGEE